MMTIIGRLDSGHCRYQRAEVVLNKYARMMNNVGMKGFLLPLLSIPLLLQSCTVYHKTTSSVDEAILAETEVKIVLEDEEIYKFRKLVRFEDEVYGLVRKKSQTNQLLMSRDSRSSDKMTLRYLKLYDNELSKIHVKNKGASTALSIVLPVVGVTAVGVLAYKGLENNVVVFEK